MNINEASAPRRLIEVWGDTADIRHLACSIVIGGAVSLGGFLVAARILADLVKSPDLARAYAMLAGLVGCLVAGALCAVLFPPKREVIEGEPADPSWRGEVLASLAMEPGGLGSTSDLPSAAAQELKELQLFELFASREPGPQAADRASSRSVQRTATLADRSA
ncbi:hypothetical protein [Cupriavidus consociatus]|uniref:hypothetical protein n=1 Tax=Cupriavidus consociatus TaxID=2821357 RepID=UPI001AE85B4F|nr:MULTISPECIES: hypothetical protein [unclassified Cupriavidus]MBP0620811.1 hypothetical protein [Cupriavidus sp. LEh25]MDK2657471.1 hypothetical protein [Cupriavidus sp. LEh21]